MELDNPFDRLRKIFLEISSGYSEQLNQIAKTTLEANAKAFRNITPVIDIQKAMAASLEPTFELLKSASEEISAHIQRILNQLKNVLDQAKSFKKIEVPDFVIPKLEQLVEAAIDALPSEDNEPVTYIEEEITKEITNNPLTFERVLNIISFLLLLYTTFSGSLQSEKQHQELIKQQERHHIEQMQQRERFHNELKEQTEQHHVESVESSNKSVTDFEEMFETFLHDISSMLHQQNPQGDQDTE